MSQPDILTISSYNSIETQTASSFDALLPNTIITPKRMILNKFIMPNLMYDISPNYNLIRINFSSDGVIGPLEKPVVVGLDTSYHFASGSAFASYLLALINATFNATYVSSIPNPLTNITYDTGTGRLTIDPTAIYRIRLISWNIPDPVTAASAWYKLGYTGTSGPGYSSYLGLGQPFTGDSPLVLLQTSVIYVSLSLLGNSLNDKRLPDGTVTGDESIYGVIPVNADFGQMIIYGDQFGSFVSTNVNTIRSIKVNLLNEEYNILKLPQNCYCTIEFRLEYN